jgi:DNA-binding transcriptional LysR family regulator
LGRKAYAIYAPILDALRSSQRRKPPGKQARPVLRVGILPGLDEDSLLVRATTATIVEWGKVCPEVELKVVESHSGVLLDWLSDKIIDVAVVEDMHARSALRETILSSEPLAILTSASYAAHAPGPIRLSEIGSLNLVLPSKRHGLRALMDRAFLSAGLPLVPKLELDSMASAMRLVKSGGWATVMPPSAVQRSIDDKLLIAHPIVKPSVKRELRAVQLPRRRNEKWETTFIHVLRERLRAGSPG